MALISLAVFDTEENKRSAFTHATLYGLLETVDFNNHRLFISDNNSCQETQDIYEKFSAVFESLYPNSTLSIIDNGSNIGTANAISQAWKHRENGEHCIKMDNDVLIHQAGWVDKMEECILRMPSIGIICGKRNDLEERVGHENQNYNSELIQLPHKRGEQWLTIEKVNHGFGTVQMYNYALLDRIGYLYQMGGIYGFDDSLASYRCRLAGFISCFLVGVDITHIDKGGDEYTKEKEEYAAKMFPEFDRVKQEYIDGTRSIYYSPFETDQ